MKNKHIHFIGICGVAMSAIAIAFQKKGWTVTGSDKGFYPPVSTHLKKTDITFYPGWHVEKMTKHGDPDIVIVGNVASSKNEEWLYVQEKNIPYKSYPEIIASHFIQSTSIVCAGTYGKTTSSALLAWIFEQHGKQPSYMFGGLTQNDFPAAQIGEGNISILEGDEYKTARWDNRPKFKSYSLTHLMLTAVSWDHADIYPTEASYMKEFEDLIEMIPKEGNITVCIDHKKALALAKNTKSTVTTYGKDQTAAYRYSNLNESQIGMDFTITHKDETHTIESPMIGSYIAENMTGVFAMAHQLGIPTNDIITHIKTFHGMKRRLEKRYEKDVIVFDDIAHSPEKAKATLQTIRKVYNGNIIAVFEPNTGNRKKESFPQYKNAFTDANEVIIGRLTKVKKENNPEHQEACNEHGLADIIKKSHTQVTVIDDDAMLVEHIIKQTKKDDVIVFLGSHGFRGMIEETIKKLEH